MVVHLYFLLYFIILSDQFLYRVLLQHVQHVSLGVEVCRIDIHLYYLQIIQNYDDIGCYQYTIRINACYNSLQILKNNNTRMKYKHKNKLNQSKENASSKIDEKKSKRSNRQLQEQQEIQKESEDQEINQDYYGQQEEMQQQQQQAQSIDHNIQQQAQQIAEQQNQGDEDLLEENQRNLQDYQKQLGNKGVVYLSRVPPYMTPNFIRKLLQNYEVQRIYLLPESQWARQNRIKKGGGKRICFRQGWIQFADKKNAKMVALSLNGQKMVHKKGSFYSQDVWNLRYLPKFKWHHLTEKLAHEQRLKKQRLRLEMEQQKKMHQYYVTQINKSKKIAGIVRNKMAKGKQIKNNQVKRNFGQKNTIEQQKD